MRGSGGNYRVRLPEGAAKQLKGKASERGKHIVFVDALVATNRRMLLRVPIRSAV
jgi:hypothetical protein